MTIEIADFGIFHVSIRETLRTIVILCHHLSRLHKIHEKSFSKNIYEGYKIINWSKLPCTTNLWHLLYYIRPTYFIQTIPDTSAWRELSNHLIFYFELFWFQKSLVSDIVNSRVKTNEQQQQQQQKKPGTTAAFSAQELNKLMDIANQIKVGWHRRSWNKDINSDENGRDDRHFCSERHRRAAVAWGEKLNEE